jgi:hypothetical protein
MGFLTAKTKLKDIRNPQARAADVWMASLLQQGTPDIPKEEIAGMSEAEKMAQKLVGEYGGREGEGLDVLRGMANAPEDILQDPTISALMNVITRRGDEASNRLSRSLMLRGGRGGAGRDILGRSVTNTQQELMSTLAPYSERAKERKMSAAQLLNQLGESSTINRLNALSTTGALPRTLQQMQNAAAYNQAMTQVLFPYQQGMGVASTLSNTQPMSVQQTPSTFSQIAPLLQSIAPAVLGQFTGGASSANAAGDWQKNLETSRGGTYGQGY